MAKYGTKKKVLKMPSKSPLVGFFTKIKAIKNNPNGIVHGNNERFIQLFPIHLLEFSKIIFFIINPNQLGQIMNDKATTIDGIIINSSLFLLLINQLTKINDPDCGFVRMSSELRLFSRRIPSAGIQSKLFSAINNKNGVEEKVKRKENSPPFFRKISSVKTMKFKLAFMATLLFMEKKRNG